MENEHKKEQSMENERKNLRKNGSVQKFNSITPQEDINSIKRRTRCKKKLQINMLILAKLSYNSVLFFFVKFFEIKIRFS